MKMKKRNAVLALFCATALLLSGCGKTETPSADSGGKQEQENQSGEASSGKDTEESDKAGDSKVLTVYAPQADADRGPWIKEQAEQALGFEVEFLCAAGADLAERLRAEKGNPQADVIMGLVQTAMYQLKGEGLLAQYTPTWAEGLPEVYKDKDGYFYSFWQTPIIIGYNPDYVTSPPASWQDLIKEEYKEQYSIGSTGSQTVRTYIIGMLWPYYDEATGEISEEGWDFLRTLYGNMFSAPADSDAWQLFKEGQLPLTLNWFGGAKSKAAAYEAPIEYVKPDQGTPVVAEGIAVVEGTDQEEMAQAFMEWWGSPETMAAYANEFGQAPAHPDAIALCNDEIKADAEMFIAQDIDWEACAEKMDGWFEKIELEIMP